MQVLNIYQPVDNCFAEIHRSIKVMETTEPPELHTRIANTKSFIYTEAHNYNCEN